MTDALSSAGIEGLAGLGLALLLGLLVGVQRGWSLRNEAAGSRFAGVRTFALFGLAGGMAAVTRAPAIAAIVSGAAAILILIGYAKSARAPDQLSGTTSLAALITLGCGYLAASGRSEMATVIAVAMTLGADGSFGIRVEARAPDSAVASVLSAIGFVETDGVMTLTQHGRWS